eukprot:2104177-Pleurochrysis_carterae.AAC.1
MSSPAAAGNRKKRSRENHAEVRLVGPTCLPIATPRGCTWCGCVSLSLTCRSVFNMRCQECKMWKSPP